MTRDELQRILEEAGHEARPQSTGDVCIVCPYCQNNNFKCYVSAEKYGGVFHCFRCGESGTIHRLFRTMNLKGGAWTPSLEQMKERTLRAKVNRKFGQVRSELPTRLVRVPLPEEYLSLSKPTSDWMGRRALIWLKRRGLSREEISEWKIGYCQRGRYGEHLILPVLGLSGEVLTFQARRFLWAVEPKCLNPIAERSSEQTLTKADVLYGLNQVQPRGPMVLVEGPFDAIALDRAFERMALPHRALAMFGHKLSSIQRSLLLGLMPMSVYVMVDGDVVLEGKRIARNLSSWLEAPVWWCPLQDGQDPDDLTDVELVKKIIRAHKIVGIPRLARIRT